MIHVLHGDCCEIMPTLEADSFHAIVTDPPYHLTSIVKRFGGKNAAPAQHGTDGAFARASRGFMGKQWDGGDVAFRVETWKAAFRVLKPGGHLLAFSGTRTYHRMVCAIEDAGFEIRDQVAWVYASGFPKSHDVSKAIDDHFFYEWLDANPEQAARLKGLKGEARKAAEAELRREAGLERKAVGPGRWNHVKGTADQSGCIIRPGGKHDETAPATPEATQWAGFGTALKPAHEPIVLARKPLSERTVAANVLAHGTGALNIDACRIGAQWRPLIKKKIGRPDVDGKTVFGSGLSPGAAYAGATDLGRWPANVCHDSSEEVLDAFAAFGERSSTRANGNPNDPRHGKPGMFGMPEGAAKDYRDSGSVARFFFSAKANTDDRLGSRHPTIKPTDLMCWLLRLVAPPGGHVLDPFAGSGSTGMAAMREGFDATLIEMEEQSVADIRNRIAHVYGRDTPLFGDAAELSETYDRPLRDLFDGDSA